MRHDWRSDIKKLIDADVKFIKWRPPSMYLDPSRVSTEFYKAIAGKLVILTHTGDSTALKVDDYFNSFADPEKFHKALQLGVEVVMLHSGRVGVEPLANEKYGETYYEKFKNMVKEYPLYLKGEYGAVPYKDSIDNFVRLTNDQININGQITPLTDFMVNGSDYPATSFYLTACRAVNACRKKGLLAKEEVEALKKLFRYNPLLFEFVFKRTLKRKNGSPAIPLEVFTKEL